MLANFWIAFLTLKVTLNLLVNVVIGFCKLIIELFIVVISHLIFILFWVFERDDMIVAVDLFALNPKTVDRAAHIWSQVVLANQCVLLLVHLALAKIGFGVVSEVVEDEVAVGVDVALHGALVLVAALYIWRLTLEILEFNVLNLVFCFEVTDPTIPLRHTHYQFKITFLY